MPENKDNNPFPFGNLFNGKHPFWENGQFDNMFPDASWVEGYVQSMLKNAVPRTAASEDAAFRYDLFQTHRSVIVRVRIPESVNENKVRVFQGASHLRIEGLPGRKDFRINLPAAVSMRNGRSKFKDGVLEIRLPKEGRGGSEREIYIEY